MTDVPDRAEPRSSLERVKADAARLGLAINVLRMDRSTRTAEDAAAACGTSVTQIVKSLVFENAANGRLALLLVSGAHAADLDHLAAAEGLRLNRCDARRVRDETGFAIGGVAPIGHLAPVPTFMDAALLDHDVVWCAAGRPDSVFSVSPAALRDAVGARILRVRA